MKKSLLILLTLCLAASAMAAYQGLPADVEKALPAIQKYPKAGSILLWVNDSYTLAANGAQSYEHHEFRYIPDESARDAFGDPHVSWLNGRDSLAILAARTYTVDGRRIDATPNALNPIVPEGGLDLMPDFTDFRQMVVTLLGLENGSIAELHYRVTTPVPNFPWLEGRLYFREEAPVISRELVVSIPQGTTLTHAEERGAPEPAVSGGTYTWKMGEQAGYLKEDLQGHRVLLPNVAFSTANGWKQIADELKSRVAKASEGSLDIPASLEEKLFGAGTDEAKLEALRVWIDERFPSLEDLEFHHRDFDLTCRSAARILQTGYGNDLETAVLEAKLGERLGLELEPVFCFVPDVTVPSLHEYNGTLLAIDLPPYPLYVHPRHPRAEFTGMELLDCFLLPLGAESATPELYETNTHKPSMEWFVTLDKLDTDTLTGHGTLSASGEWGVYEAVREAGPEDYLSAALTIEGLEITKATIRELENPRHGGSVVVDFEFTASALDTADGHSLLPLAMVDFKQMTASAPWGLLKREFRQEVGMPGAIRLTVDAALPDGWDAITMPRLGVRTWDFDEGRVECAVKHKGEGNRLSFTRSLTLTVDWITAESWPAYRSFVLDCGPHARNGVVFGSKTTAAK